MVKKRRQWQTILNIFAAIEEDRIRHKNQLVFIRDKIQTLNLDPTGTNAEGKLAALNNRANEIIDDAGSPLALQIIAAKIPSHRNRALGDIPNG